MSGVEARDVGAALDRRVDPVSQADEYRTMLLGLLGDRDPAEVQRETLGQLEAILRDAGSDLRIRPAEGEWSVLELIGHILDAEIVSGARYRWILAHDEPALLGYDQDLWVDRLHGPDDDPGEMLSLFRALRASHLALWSATMDSDKARVGIHAERGPESLDLTFRLIAGHGLYHLGQMRRTLEQIAS